MQEMRIIVPIVTPAQQTARNTIVDAILDLAGGFTRIFGQGAWRSPQGVTYVEDVAIFDIAVVPHGATESKIVGAALDALKVAGEEALYVRFANGDVRIIPTVAP